MRSDEELLNIPRGRLGELTDEELRRVTAIYADRVSKGMERMKALEAELETRKKPEFDQ
jgi:hypothetical protein